MTGLAAGCASGAPVFEAEHAPGGICASYYVTPAGARSPTPPAEPAYRFEVGGGHWIFGGDDPTHAFLRELTPLRSYARHSAVYLPREALYVPYPLQNNLRALGPERASAALLELTRAARERTPIETLAEWLRATFGSTLCELFFLPFHARYTAGLHERIAPQDAYKSPVDLAQVTAGAEGEPEAVGYNQTFLYPTHGLDALARALAERCDVRYGKRAERIDLAARRVAFADGSEVPYERLLSTLPLNRTLSLCGIQLDAPANPSPGVLVVNLGARRGPRCPDEHWVYVPESQSGFHRVGCYSNVEPSFLPEGHAPGAFVSLYVEFAYPEDTLPDAAERARAAEAAIAELREWGWIEEVEVCDPTLIEVAYTWSWPRSSWVREGLATLEAAGVQQVGRYARWVFQGIAESLREGLEAGKALR